MQGDDIKLVKDIRDEFGDPNNFTRQCFLPDVLSFSDQVAEYAAAPANYEVFTCCVHHVKVLLIAMCDSALSFAFVSKTHQILNPVEGRDTFTERAISHRLACAMCFSCQLLDLLLPPPKRQQLFAAKVTFLHIHGLLFLQGLLVHMACLLQHYWLLQLPG